MAKLEDLTRGAAVRCILPDAKWVGNAAVELTYEDAAGRLRNELLYRDREPTLEVVTSGRPWSFDGDGRMFRPVSEAQRIGMAFLFDPLLSGLYQGEKGKAMTTNTAALFPLEISSGGSAPCRRGRFLVERSPPNLGV